MLWLVGGPVPEQYVFTSGSSPYRNHPLAERSAHVQLLIVDQAHCGSHNTYIMSEILRPICHRTNQVIIEGYTLAFLGINLHKMCLLVI